MVSVIIPTYNRAELLLETVKSILCQTYKDFEIIIVDDGSDDGTSEVISALKSSKITYVNAGRVNNISFLRNTGIRKSAGDYIAFCDDDDLWVENKLEIQNDYLKKFNFVCCNALLIGENGNILKENYFETENDLLLNTGLILKSNFILTPSVILSRKLMMNNLFDDVNYTFLNEDFSLWLKISEQSKMFYLNDKLVKIREHNSITRKFENKIRIQEEKLKIFEKYLLNQDPEIINSAVRATLDSRILKLKLFFSEKLFSKAFRELCMLCKTLSVGIFRKEFRNILKEKFLT